MEQFFNNYSGTIAALSLIVSTIALIIAYIALKDQKKCKFTIEALPMVASNNDRFFGFPSLKKPQLKISNTGNKAITVTEIAVCVGREIYSLPQSSSRKINLFIEPGKVEYYTYDRDYVIDLVTLNKHKKDYVVCWKAKTNDGKTARCKSNNRVSDFINVNLSGEKEDD